jgi:hypothetical protein
MKSNCIILLRTDQPTAEGKANLLLSRPLLIHFRIIKKDANGYLGIVNIAYL